MSKITNVSNTTLLIGRFKLTPGTALPVIPYTAKEKADIDHFVKLGRLMVEDVVKPEPVEAPKPVVDESVIAPIVVEEPAPEAPVVEEPVVTDEPKAEKKRKNKKAE